MGEVQHVGWRRLVSRWAHQIHILPENALQLIHRDSVDFNPGDAHREEDKKRMATTYKYGRIKTGFLYGELLRWLAKPVADAMATTERAKIAEMMASACVDCELENWPLVFAQEHPATWSAALSPIYNAASNLYYVMIPKVAPGTHTPLVGENGFVQLWQDSPDEYFKLQVDNYVLAILAHAKDFAHDDALWVIRHEVPTALFETALKAGQGETRGRLLGSPSRLVDLVAEAEVD